MGHVACVDMIIRTLKNLVSTPEEMGPRSKGQGHVRKTCFCFLEPTLYAAEMKLLRPLAGYTLYDHKTKDYIRRELRITGILDKIDEYRRNWLSHLQRMQQNRIPLKSYHYRPQGRRTIGRPKKRWREQL